MHHRDHLRGQQDLPQLLVRLERRPHLQVAPDLPLLHLRVHQALQDHQVLLVLHLDPQQDLQLGPLVLLLVPQLVHRDLQVHRGPLEHLAHLALRLGP